jgi:hypothetical protein
VRSAYGDSSDVASVVFRGSWVGLLSGWRMDS